MKRFRALAALALALMILALAGCRGREASGAARVLLDGEVWSGAAIAQPEGDGLRVYITLDGAALIELPFSQARTVTVEQPGIGENTVELTGDHVVMLHADCENQDCVNMGEVTAENLELRVMGGFIVCLPHKLSVEVREFSGQR